MPCRFCDFDKMRDATVYSDANVYAIVSRRPLSYGHILVIPKKHVERLEELSIDETATLFGVIRNLLPKLLNVVNARDYNLFINAGPRANQNVLHLHVHVVPRRTQEDRLGAFFAAFANERGQRLSRKAIAKIAGSIRKGLS